MLWSVRQWTFGPTLHAFWRPRSRAFFAIKIDFEWKHIFNGNRASSKNDNKRSDWSAAKSKNCKFVLQESNSQFYVQLILGRVTNVSLISHVYTNLYTFFFSVEMWPKQRVPIWINFKMFYLYCELNYHDEKIRRTLTHDIQKHWTSVSTLLGLISRVCHTYTHSFVETYQYVYTHIHTYIYIRIPIKQWCQWCRLYTTAIYGHWFDLQWWRSWSTLLMRPNKAETAVQCFRMSCIGVRRIFSSW